MAESIVSALARFGGDSTLRELDRAKLYLELEAMSLEREVSWAILRGDRKRLDSMLSVVAVPMCLLSLSNSAEELVSRAAVRFCSISSVETP